MELNFYQGLIVLGKWWLAIQAEMAFIGRISAPFSLRMTRIASLMEAPVVTRSSITTTFGGNSFPLLPERNEYAPDKFAKRAEWLSFV